MRCDQTAKRWNTRLLASVSTSTWGGVGRGREEGERERQKRRRRRATTAPRRRRACERIGRTWFSMWFMSFWKNAMVLRVLSSERRQERGAPPFTRRARARAKDGRLWCEAREEHLLCCVRSLLLVAAFGAVRACVRGWMRARGVVGLCVACVCASARRWRSREEKDKALLAPPQSTCIRVQIAPRSLPHLRQRPRTTTKHTLTHTLGSLPEPNSRRSLNAGAQRISVSKVSLDSRAAARAHPSNPLTQCQAAAPRRRRIEEDQEEEQQGRLEPADNKNNNPQRQQQRAAAPPHLHRHQPLGTTVSLPWP